MMKSTKWTAVLVTIGVLGLGACDSDTGISPSQIDTPVAVDTAAATVPAAPAVEAAPAATPDPNNSAASCSDRFTSLPQNFSMDGVAPANGLLKLQLKKDHIDPLEPVHVAVFDTQGGTLGPGDQIKLFHKTRTFDNQPVLHLNLQLPDDCREVQIDTGCGENPPRGGKYTHELNDYWNVRTDACVVGREPKPKGCDMEVIKSARRSGPYIRYRIDFKNVGDDDCTGGGVKVSDRIPKGTYYIGGSHWEQGDGNYVQSCHTGKCKWNYGTMEPGEEGAVGFKVKLRRCQSSVTNTVNVWSREQGNVQASVTTNLQCGD